MMDVTMLPVSDSHEATDLACSAPQICEGMTNSTAKNDVMKIGIMALMVALPWMVSTTFQIAVPSTASRHMPCTMSMISRGLWWQNGVMHSWVLASCICLAAFFKLTHVCCTDLVRDTLPTRILAGRVSVTFFVDLANLAELAELAC